MPTSSDQTKTHQQYNKCMVCDTMDTHTRIKFSALKEIQSCGASRSLIKIKLGKAEKYLRLFFSHFSMGKHQKLKLCIILIIVLLNIYRAWVNIKDQITHGSQRYYSVIFFTSKFKDACTQRIGEAERVSGHGIEAPQPLPSHIRDAVWPAFQDEVSKLGVPSPHTAGHILGYETPPFTAR